MAKIKADARVELIAGMDAHGAAMPEGTVVRIRYRYDANDRRAKRYTFTALWIANAWYTTGQTTDVVSRTLSHADFMKLLASEHVTKAEVATSFDRFK